MMTTAVVNVSKMSLVDCECDTAVKVSQLTCFTLNVGTGFWMLHCHMEYHNADGMSLIFQEGDIDNMNSLPAGFKTCGNFEWNEEAFRNKLGHLVSAGTLAFGRRLNCILHNLPSPVLELW